MEGYFIKVYFTENELKVFKILDKFKGKSVDRYTILDELGWERSKTPLLHKIIYKFNNIGIFDIQITYKREKMKMIPYITITPKYDKYKIVNNECCPKVLVWIRIIK